MLAETVPISLLLELLSLPLIYTVAIWTGIRQARSRGEWVDFGIGTFLLGLYSVPEIWAGVLMIGFLTNNAYIHWFPSNGLHDLLSDSMAFLPSWTHGHFEQGWLLDIAWHLCLPLLCLSYGSFAFLSRLQRGALLESLGQDYVRTARARACRKTSSFIAMPFATASCRLLPSRPVSFPA